eukprot:TRINITY_DN15072_c0_g1_i1.p1 TRINITY_DN15072_c0_g1~~TRINITY_DN15072_c0_g1_i1.p1  ORF type:complete len:167 (-),score=23.85 TRINITY_DN15072_c0_g1_i1:154-654(-)
MTWIFPMAILSLSLKKSDLQIVGLSKHNKTTVFQSEADTVGCVEAHWGAVTVACVIGPSVNCISHVRHGIATEEECLIACANNNKSKRKMTAKCVVFIWEEQECTMMLALSRTQETMLCYKEWIGAKATKCTEVGHPPVGYYDWSLNCEAQPTTTTTTTVRHPSFT